MAIVVRSSWQVKQWAKIQRQVTYSVTCNLCGWGDVTSSRKEAEELFRRHVEAEHGSK
jgi:hypothetical protein